MSLGWDIEKTILTYLQPLDLIRVARVCKGWCEHIYKELNYDRKSRAMVYVPDKTKKVRILVETDDITGFAAEIDIKTARFMRNTLQLFLEDWKPFQTSTPIKQKGGALINFALLSKYHGFLLLITNPDNSTFRFGINKKFSYIYSLVVYCLHKITG